MSLVRTVRNIRKHESGIITPRMERFFETHDELEVRTPEEEELLLRLMRPSPNSERSGRFGASSRGLCRRRQVFAYLGMPVARIMDPELKNIFWDGKLRHIKWQLMGMQAGVFTHVEWGLSIPEWRSSISLDGLNMDEGWLFELKGMSNFVSTMTELSHKHLLQIHTYFFFTGWDVCVYVVEDKRIQDWREIVVRKDHLLMGKVERELDKLNQAVEERELPEIKSECYRKKGEYKECPYAAQCLKHEDFGDPWPEDQGWQSGVSTGLQVGRRVRPSRNASRAS